MAEQNEPEKKNRTRREFLQVSAAAGAASLAAGAVAQTAEKAAKEIAGAPAVIRKLTASDTINVGYIGVGVRGKQHMRYSGFFHPKDRPEDQTATVNLPRPLNVRCVAMSDCYEGNREWAKGAVPDIKLYPNFEDLLADKNVDAIFIGTSDHNHAPIGIAAAKAGKHVYSEKCFANSMEDAIAYRDAVKAAGVVFQLGHQTRSGSIMEKARKAINGIGPEGNLGKITLIETYTNRNNANGAWLYKIPTGAGPQNIDWERFTGKGPKRPFDLDRFFRFRKYWDYGTGQSGDLITHEMDAIQQITGLGIPNTCVATGGIYFKDWDIGATPRETPDTFNAAFNYEKEQVLVTYAGTLANSRPRERTFYGHDATLDMSKGIKIYIDQDSDRYAEKIEKGEWELRITDEADDKERDKIYKETTDSKKWTLGKGIYIDIINGKQVNVTGLHVLNFVECVREGKVKTNCDINMAFDEAVIAHMATQSYQRGRRVRWDPVGEKIVNDA